MLKLSRIGQFWRRSQFEGAYSAACKSDNIHERRYAAEFALGIVEKLYPWPDSIDPKALALGKLHHILAHAYNELGETDVLKYSGLALEEATKAVAHLTKADGVEWARAMTTLSIASASSLEGNHDDNIERAIESAEAALDILTVEAHRDDWLNAKVNLAAFYSTRRRENLTMNIEESLRLYQEVYEVVSNSGSPLQQARALIGLADNHMERRLLLKEQNIDQAIELLEKALTLISPEEAPRAWTTAKSSLSIAYRERLDGDKNENLELALAANSECLEVLERIGARERWATVKMMRCTLLEDYQGERTMNLREAIEAAQSALEVFTPEQYPDEYARVLQRLNRLRSAQHDDNRSEVIEEIISKQEAPIPSLSAESDPYERASLLVSLGNTYAERVKSDRIENMERSIEYLEQAVPLFDQHARPLEWGSAVLSLAQSYHERTRGLHADNIEKTIALCERALVLISNSSDPEEHSGILETLGEAFTRRVRGNRKENLAKAIQIFGVAQTRRDREHNPEAWLRLEQKFLQAEHIFASITASESSTNDQPPVDVEKYLQGLHASADMIKATDHPRTWMAAHLFLADTYTRVLPPGMDISDHFPFVDACCANYRKAVSIYESMLPVADKLGDQDQRALLHERIGLAYGLMQMFSETQSRASEDDAAARSRFVQQARSYYESAVAAHTATMEINSLDRSPRKHLQSAVGLGQLYVHEREWVAAEEIFASGAAAADKLLGDIELSESEMKEVLDVLRNMATFAPYVSLMLGKPTRAIELLEIGRARILAKALTLESLPLAPEQRIELHEKQRELNVHERRLLSPRLFDRMTPLQKSIDLRRDIKSIVERTNLTDHFTGSAVAALESVVADGSVVVIPVLTGAGGRILVCFSGNGKAETCVVECPDGELISSIAYFSDLKKGRGWMKEYFSPESHRKTDEVLSAAGEALGEVFATPLVEVLDSLNIGPGTHLDVLPQGALGILPLALARDARSGQLLLDRYELSLSPSLVALHHAKKRARIIPESFVALANPTGDLPFAEWESHVLRNWLREVKFEGRPELMGRAVSPEEVLEALPLGEVWHFATHGRFNSAMPLKSGLSLGQERELTLEMIFETRSLNAPRLVVLSACDTGLYDLANLPFEFIGLPSGFLHAGAAGVVSTLWPVDDHATAMIMGKFYEEYLNGRLTPSAALRSAQLWLRNATWPDLLEAIDSWGRPGKVSTIGELKDELAQHLRGKRSSRGLVNETLESTFSTLPFSSPHYWSGFVHYGV